MLNKNNFFLITIFCISIGLISYFTVSHIKSIRELKELANEVPEFVPTTFLDLNDENVVEEILQKIEKYKSLESNQIRHFSLSEIEEKEKNSKKLRNLVDANTFEDVGLIDPMTESYYYIMEWMAKKMRQYTSSIILYPYGFNYSYLDENKTTQTREFKQGAFISLNSSELPEFQNLGFRTNGTFSAQKAKAVFDTDIAILSIDNIKKTYKEDCFQDGVDWSSFFSHILRGSTLYNYLEFLKAKEKETSRTFVTRINETEVINGYLLNEGLPRFGILIIPDYQLGTDDIIKSKLGQKGIQNIIEYFNKGGRIVVDGKSGTLLEDFGLMDKGVYNRSKLLSKNHPDRDAPTTGCLDTLRKKYSQEENDFAKQFICFYYTRHRYLPLASSFKSVKSDSKYTPLIYLDTSNQYLVTTNVEDGLTYNLTEEDKKYNPLLLYRENDMNGQIYVLNYNPIYEGSYSYINLNIITLALSKDLFLTSKVKMDINSNHNKDLPIPAGESGFLLKVNTIIHNLNDKNIENAIVYIFLPEHFGWSEKPSKCEKKVL